MYRVLYRKYRPRTFDGVAGQGHITETLKNQVRTGKLSHAYLFIGTRGTGKTTCAKILARAVNCENPVEGNPCNKCKSCIGIEDGSILDVVELDAASNNGVDNVRALRDEAVFSPAYVKKRVYIIDEVHMLSTSAFNALLKILEEPPGHLMFILATTELHKVPATILSRCQRHSFKRLDSEIISKQLEFVANEEGMRLTEDAAELLGRLADGAMRDGLTLLDQCSGHELIDSQVILQSIGLAGSRRTAELLDAVSARDADKAMTIFRGLWKDGKEPSTILDELCTLERDVLMTIVAPKGGAALLSGGYDMPTLKAFAGKLGAGELMKGMDTLRKALTDLRSCPNPRTVAELCIIEMCRPEPEAPPERNDTRPPTAADAAKPPEPKAEKAGAPPPAPEKPEEKLAFEEAPATEEPCATEGLPPWEEAANERPVERAAEFEEARTEPGADNKEGGSADPVWEDAALWDTILRMLKGKLPVGTYAMISDKFHGEGGLEDGSLIVRAKSGFAKNMFSASEVVEAIKSVAAQVIGRPVPVKIVNGGDKTAANGNKLDFLAKFGNVEFE